LIRLGWPLDVRLPIWRVEPVHFSVHYTLPKHMSRAMQQRGRSPAYPAHEAQPGFQSELAGRSSQLPLNKAGGTQQQGSNRGAAMSSDFVELRLTRKKEMMGLRLKTVPARPEEPKVGKIEVMHVYPKHKDSFAYKDKKGRQLRNLPEWANDPTPAAIAGIRPGDMLALVNGKQIADLTDITSGGSHHVDKFKTLLHYIGELDRDVERPLIINFYRAARGLAPASSSRQLHSHDHGDHSDDADALERNDRPMDPHFKVKISQFDLDNICKWAMEFPHLETGGDLFGQWLQDGNCVIKNAIGPGDSAVRSSVTFNQGMEFLRSAGQYLHEHQAFHIGDWHSYVE